MLIEWLAVFDYCHRRMPQGARHPLEDPLERPEWDGLRWIVELSARWRARHRHALTAAPDVSRGRERAVDAGAPCGRSAAASRC